MEKLILYFGILVGLFLAVHTKCPKDWAEIGHECLMFSASTKSWSDAQTFCRSQYSYLASDDSEEKHNFIRQVVSVLDGARIKNFFLGGNDQVFEGQWRWLETGSPIKGFTAWGPDKPSPNMTLALKQNCMMLEWVGDDIFWTDWDCGDRRAHFICEKQASSFTNTPVIG